ncbi:unnamed protein product [Urochloa humidicola]
MSGAGLSHLWSPWGIQILVLISFTLQVLLLVFGGMRRRGLSTWQRITLWFAYLLADSTAIYALGHLSVTRGSHEHQLVAFWAPFLLLHLGGPDNITAYAQEDNSLWLRHLQTLGVQVLGVAYILYCMAGSGTLLLLASICMFLAGLVKYGERTWALKCGNLSSIANSAGKVDPYQLLRQGMDEEELLLRAHSQFSICRCAFTDTKLELSTKPLDDRAICVNPGGSEPDLSPLWGDDIYKVVEMELSLMYDLLYTKAAVIHTWYGFCIHFISLIGTATTFWLFQLSVSSRGSGYSRVDVVISYVLLIGALVLEVISVCRAVLSSWTCFFILCKAEGYSGTPAALLKWLIYVLCSLRKPFKMASRRLWRASIGQYNLLHLCSRDRTDLGSRLAMKIGLEEWWNKLHFSGTFSGNNSLSMQRLKELVLEVQMRTEYENTIGLNSRGRVSLEKYNACNGIAQWSVRSIDFDESILIWHMATDFSIWRSEAANESCNLELMEATRVLSNYMMFLLVKKPNMLPGRASHKIYSDTRKYLEEGWNAALDDEDKSAMASSGCWNKCCILKELFHHEGPNCSSTVPRPQRRKLGKKLNDYCQEKMTFVEVDPWTGWITDNYLDKKIRHLRDVSAFTLARELDGLAEPERRSDLWELIFAVWVEMMLYAAEYCRRDVHARELSNGGEFMTIVWLLQQNILCAKNKGSK